MKQRYECAHQWRNSKGNRRAGLRIGNNFRGGYRVSHQRHGNQKAGDGPGDADIEKRPTRGDGRTDSQYGPERAEQSGERNEIRVADFDAVIFAGEKMSELMGQKESEQRKRKRDAEQQQVRMLERRQDGAEQAAIAGELLDAVQVELLELRT